MKITTAFAGLILSAVGAVRAAEIRSHEVDWKRDSSLLIDPAAMPKLPTPAAAKAASNAAGLNLDDIQGDILIGMKKNKEFFLFFSITDAAKFKQKLKSSILPLVTSTMSQIYFSPDKPLQPYQMLNMHDIGQTMAYQASQTG